VTMTLLCRTFEGRSGVFFHRAPKNIDKREVQTFLDQWSVAKNSLFPNYAILKQLKLVI